MPLVRTIGLQSSLRAASAAAIAYWVAAFFPTEHAIYALVAAVIVTDLSPRISRHLAWQRFAGTLVGAATGASMTYLLPVGPIAIGVGIFVAMLLTFALRLDGAAKVSGYVAAIVLLAHGDEPWVYAVLRAWETAIGIAAALLVSYVPKLMRERDSS